MCEKQYGGRSPYDDRPFGVRETGSKKSTNLLKKTFGWTMISIAISMYVVTVIVGLGGGFLAVLMAFGVVVFLGLIFWGTHLLTS